VDVPDRKLTFRELARAAVPGPPGMEPGLYAAHFFEAPKMTYPYGTHVAVVEVDVDTGAVNILRYPIAWDVGKAVNPMIVDGQMVGALAQGIGRPPWRKMHATPPVTPASATRAQ